MKNSQPTETLGRSISAWDRFYQDHFDEVYRKSLEICHNTLIAKELTDKLFVKAFFNNPELIVENNAQALHNEMGIMLPYHNVYVAQDKELSAGRLLHIYYQAN